MKGIKFLTDLYQIHSAYKRVFESEDGQVVLRHLMKIGYMTRSTFVAGDPQRTALNEGSRRLVLSILRITKKNPQEIQREIEDLTHDNS
jgi:hypothetical protein